MPFLVEPDEENVKEKIKISERYLSLSFNGNFLILRVVESKKILAFHYKAVSGRPLENGKFDYSKERQKVKGEGPLPKGEYFINPQEIQYSKN